MSKRNQQQSEGINLGDIYYVLFRRKKVIIFFAIIGVIAAGVICVLKPPQYESEAKLLIRYVMDKTIGAADNDVTMKSPERGDTIIDTEIQILTSVDLAQQVVKDVGAVNILAKAGGGEDTNAAAALVLKNLSIDPLSKGSVIQIDFQSPDRDVAQSVLREVIRNYYKNHAQTHQAVGVFGDFLTAETKRLHTELEDTEKQLRAAKNAAGVISLDEAKSSAIEQMTKVREDLLNAEAELAEHRAILNDLPGASKASPNSVADTASLTNEIPEAKMREYRNVSLRLADDLRQEQDAIVVRQLREESIFVQEIRDQISKDEQAKKKMEQEYPRLASLQAIASASTPGSASITGAIDLASEAARVRMLEGKTNRLHAQLAQIRLEASKIEDAEDPIQELQRQKDLKEANLKHFLTSLEQSHIDEELGTSKGGGEISVVENPTPPNKKRPKVFKKLLGMALGGSLGAGIALAFLLEMFFDHTVRRPVDIERKLRLPLFVSIPDLSQKGRKLPALTNGHSPLLLHNGNGETPPPAEGDVAPDNGPVAVPSWDRNHALHPFYQGLRERLIVNFEVRNLTHNPKLVAVTSCGKGAGVSSIAAGLAASLSETGDGNVLLVDMHGDQNTARQFHQGKLGCRLDDALESETMGNAMVGENFYVVSEPEATEDTPPAQSRKFSSLVPKLKASDYDYIIFDMPPVTQTSMTPRLAGLMDMVLLVIESEKTSRESVQRANALLAESKAHVNTVLNKTRSYVPPSLHQEFLNDV